MSYVTLNSNGTEVDATFTTDDEEIAELKQTIENLQANEVEYIEMALRQGKIINQLQAALWAISEGKCYKPAGAKIATASAYAAKALGHNYTPPEVDVEQDFYNKVMHGTREDKT